MATIEVPEHPSNAGDKDEIEQLSKFDPSTIVSFNNKSPPAQPDRIATNLALEALLQVRLHERRVLGLRQDLEQLIVREEVES